MDLVPQPNVTAIRQARVGQSDFVPHLGIDEVRRLAISARARVRVGNGERDELLIQTLFDGCFRVSEVTSISPNRLVHTPDGWVARIVGKGDKVAEVALTPSIVARLKTYMPARDQIQRKAVPDNPAPGLAGRRIVPSTRPVSASRTMSERSTCSGTRLKYMKPLSAKESLRIQQRVDLK